LFSREGAGKKGLGQENFGQGKRDRYSTTHKHGWGLCAQRRLCFAPLSAGIHGARHESSAMLPERRPMSWQRLLARSSLWPWLVLRPLRTPSEAALLLHDMQGKLSAASQHLGCSPCQDRTRFHAGSYWVWVWHMLGAGVYPQALANDYLDLWFLEVLSLTQGRILPSKEQCPRKSIS